MMVRIIGVRSKLNYLFSTQRKFCGLLIIGKSRLYTSIMFV